VVKVRILFSLDGRGGETDGKDFQQGDVLVTDMTDPDWEPIMKKASAIITNKGGRTCHAAIVAREMGVPAIVGCGNATDLLDTGMEVTASCCEGDTGIIYHGIIPFHKEETMLSDILRPLKRRSCSTWPARTWPSSSHTCPTPAWVWRVRSSSSTTTSKRTRWPCCSTRNWAMWPSAARSAT
jgi:phosphohistidine swiveling domain-containing protein